MSKKLSVLMAAIFLIMTCSAHAVNKFKIIKYKPGQIYTIYATRFMGTHIILPEDILTKPICGNNDLWDVDGQVGSNHVFLKPNSTDKNGGKTTLTIIGISNTSYEFLLIRTTNEPNQTIKLEKSSNFTADNNLASWQSPAEIKVKNLNIEVANLHTTISKNKKLTEEKIIEALKKYRRFLYTAYTWKRGSGFNATNLVKSVYDDGRFTFIRVEESNRGLNAATGEIDGKMEVLQYQMDTPNIYKISGLYPKIHLKYGKNEIKIERRDNLSNGVY